MNKNLKIAVLGATGIVGNYFVVRALEAGCNLRVLVRNKTKFKHADHPNVEVIVGDAAKSEDVEKVLSDVDVVVSCLGNVKKVTIMYASHNNILNAATKQANPPRCLFISTIGCGGSSWLIKNMLILIGGKAGFNDYEKADKRVREEQNVPCVLIRPYALTNKPGLGAYKILEKTNGTFAKPISRDDVAKFFLDCVTDKKWDGKPVLLGGQKKK